MLTAKRAFHGDTPADTMSAILKEDPPEMVETGRGVPPGLERIVRHCLEKSPAQRFQSASDVAFDLEALSEISATSKRGVQPLPPRRRRWLVGAGAAILVLASYVLVFLAGKHRSGTSSAASFHRLTFRRGTIMAARFSPDGQTIVYGAALEGRPFELFTTRFDSTDSRPLGLENTQLLGISVNGEMAIATNLQHWAAFLDVGTLGRVPLAGGAPRDVLENVAWGDWTPDGSDLAVIRRSRGLTRLESPPTTSFISHTAGSVTCAFRLKGNFWRSMTTYLTGTMAEW